jgi:regulatory protein
LHEPIAGVNSDKIKWGKNKIIQGLKQKSISSKLIEIALSEIDEEEYKNALREILDKKKKLLKEENAYKRKAKIANYAIGKGFEAPLVFEMLNS